ncbi:leucine-rich repeat flightless-interacting protein 1-like isoform X13 [Triplophysa dalaica]|uniref:leucine-rich repeat flightless-interacting protein 1-like isoform X13 n=1 Tax=Triplophysa dalaica TaxID=1582913 RepID=UPI0024E03E7C|nr:leucine-rich repeat flightless-interacting protein 1-like isoform X13 [Triplophysa dalaica]
MGSHGPGRKRTTSKNGLTAEEDALNVIAREAEARLAAKRAARAEAREIRMKELERQQKEIYQVQKKYSGLDNLDNKWGDIEQWMEDSERYTRLSRRHASVSDDEERISVGSRSNIRSDLDASGGYGGLPQIPSSHSHKKSKKKKKHSSKTSNGYDDDLSTLSSRSSRLSDESKRSLSSRRDLQSSTYYSPEQYSSSSYSSKHQGLSYNGYKLSLLHSRKHRGPVYEDSLYSGSRRSSVRASSEYSGFKGSSSRTSSRANSACSSPVADDRLERDYLEKGSSRASTISGTTLTSLGGTSSRRGSGDTSFTADTEVSIREIKESLMEVEGKYRKAMVSNAQMDNEKTNLIYEVDILKDSLMELEEMLSETRRELEDKSKDFEREKHAHSILQFQYNELKETLKQSEELLTKHGIVLGHDLATNGETGEDVGETEQSSQTSSVEIREGSSVLGTHQLKMCKDQDRKNLDKDVKENQVSSHVPLSSTEKSLDTNENGDLRDEVNQSEEQQSDNIPESKPPSSVGDHEIVETKSTDEIEAEQLVLEDSGGNTVEMDVHTDGPMETDQQESICAKQIIKKETSLESVSGPILEDQPAEDVLDSKSKPVEKHVESLHTEKVPQTQGASVSNKKKKKKKKSKQKQKQSDKLESEAKIDSKNEKVLNEDNPDLNLKSDQEGNHEEHLRNDVSKAIQTEIPADVTHDDKSKVEMDCVKKIITDKHDDAGDRFQVIPDVVDSAEISNSESTKSVPSAVSIYNLTDQTDVSANPPQEVSSENDALLSYEVSDKIVDTADRCVETLDSVSRSDNIEKSLMGDDTEVKSHVDSDALVEEEKLQSIDPEETAFSGDNDESVPKCPLASSVTEKLENESENVVKEQSTSHNSIEVEQKEVKTQEDELVEEALHSGEAFNEDSNIDTAVSESQLVLEKGEDEEEERSLYDQLLPDQESLGASDQESKLEKGDHKKEGSFQGPITIDMQLPGEVENILADKCEKEESIQVMLDVEIPGYDKGILVEKGECHENEVSIQDPVMPHTQLPGDNDDVLIKEVEEHEKEDSVQDQVMLDTELYGEDEGVLVELVRGSPELREDAEEEDEGETFDFDEMDLEASSDDPPKHCKDQVSSDVTLLKEVHEANKECQSDAINEDHIQDDDEPLGSPDQDSEQQKQMDDENTIGNPETMTEVETCLTEDTQVYKKDIKPDHQQQECTVEKHQKTSEELRHRDPISEMETKDVGQEMKSLIINENPGIKTSREQEAERETTMTNKEDDRKETKKSSKKGKSKGKEDCKMS